MRLDDLLDDVRGYAGLRRKEAVSAWALRFVREGAEDLHVGDDAGAVPVPGGYLLLSAEGILPELLADPSFAGRCAVSAAVNDIYAMGGRPLGLATVVFAGGFSDEARERFLEGLDDGLRRYDIPMLGGHTSPEGERPVVAVAVIGLAKALLSGSGARAGDELLLACDLEGRRHGSFFAWDSVTSEPAEVTRRKLEVMVGLAERGTCTAARDVSNPGMLGTLAMMLEASRAGARVRLDDVPVPGGVELDWWLEAYPSYGFILAAEPGRSEDIRETFGSEGVTCEVIGEFTAGSRLEVACGGESALFLDWRETPVTGLFGGSG